MRRSALCVSVAVLLCIAFIPRPAQAQPVQNDAGTGGDAPDSQSYAVEISPGTYSGMIYGSSSSPYYDPDYYKFYVESGTSIHITLTAGTDYGGDPYQSVFLFLYDISETYSSYFGFNWTIVNSSIIVTPTGAIFPRSGEIQFTALKTGYMGISINGGYDWSTYTFSLSLGGVQEMDFAITVDPSSGSVPLGGSVSTTITISTSGIWSEYHDLIDLSANGAPSDASIIFSNPVLCPAYGWSSSTMTVSVPDNTPPGQYTLTVTGEGSISIGKTHSENWFLNVEATATPGRSPSNFDFLLLAIIVILAVIGVSVGIYLKRRKPKRSRSIVKPPRTKLIVKPARKTTPRAASKWLRMPTPIFFGET